MKKNIFVYHKIPEQKKSGFDWDINKKKQIQSNIKNIWLAVWFILWILFYGISVNLASTKWYFLKQANLQKAQVESSYNIVKFNINQYQKNIRDQIPHSRDKMIIDIETDIAYK